MTASGQRGRERHPALRVGFRVGRYPALSETFIAAQILDMAARGLEVSVLADEVGPCQASRGSASVTPSRPQGGLGAAIFDLLPWRLRRMWISRAERRWARLNDVVVCNFGWFGAKYARSFRGREAPPFITIFHGDDVSRSLKNDQRIYDELLTRCDTMLAVSRLWRDRLLALGAPPANVQVHRMGVDLADLPFVARSGPVRELLHVGRLVEKKGATVLLHALALCREAAPAADLRLTIIGTGPLETSLREQAVTLSLQSNVAFLGARPHAEVRERLRKADIFVLPSLTAADGDMEGVPVALMEAMAAGVPVVSTQHSGIPELITHGVSGLLAAEGDAFDLAQQLLRAVRDEAGRVAMACEARRVVEREFSQARLHDVLHARISGLAQRGPQGPEGPPTPSTVLFDRS